MADYRNRVVSIIIGCANILHTHIVTDNWHRLNVMWASGECAKFLLGSSLFRMCVDNDALFELILMVMSNGVKLQRRHLFSVSTRGVDQSYYRLWYVNAVIEYDCLPTEAAAYITSMTWNPPRPRQSIECARSKTFQLYVRVPSERDHRGSAWTYITWTLFDTLFRICKLCTALNVLHKSAGRA